VYYQQAAELGNKTAQKNIKIMKKIKKNFIKKRKKA